MNKLKNFLEIIITLLFIALFVCAILQVLTRYVLPYSLPWTEEMARFILIYITFIGAAVAIYEKSHITITILVSKLSAALKLKIQILIDLLILFFLYLVFRGGIDMVLLSWGIVSGSMPWMMKGYVYLIIPISMVLMVIFLVRQVIENILALKKLNK